MYQRIHSFSTRTNPSQITTFVVFFLTPAVFYAATINLLLETEKIAFIALFTVCQVLTICFAVWTGQIDPTDDIHKAYTLNKNKYFFAHISVAKVIVNCDRCKSKKQVYNAHCIICKRCIEHQDHHCDFLNICIGERNYKHFFATVVLAFTTLLIYIIVFGIAMRNLHEFEEYSLRSAEVIVSIITVIIDTIAFCPIGMLLGLHIYLRCKNITTRQWIHPNRVIPRQNVIKVTYMSVDDYHHHNNETLNQTQNILFQGGSSQALPLSQNPSQRLQIVNQNTPFPIQSQLINVVEAQKTASISIVMNQTTQQIGVKEKQDTENVCQSSIYSDMQSESSVQRDNFGSSKKLNEIQDIDPSQLNSYLQKNQQKVQKDSKAVTVVHDQPIDQVQDDQKQSKLKNLIIKSRILSSIIGVSKDDPQMLEREAEFQNHKQMETKRSRLGKNQSMGTIQNSSWQGEKISIDKRRMKTTVEVNEDEIDLDVAHTNKNKVLSKGTREMTQFQYFAEIQVGSSQSNKPQIFTVVFDTGSHSLWIPSIDCFQCPPHFNKFSPNESLTFTTQFLKQNITYGKGDVTGIVATDIVEFQGLKVNAQILLVNQGNDVDGMKADGLMGLSNWKNQSNIFDLAYRTKQLVSSIFGFKLGMEELRETSYFYFNISLEDFQTASFVNTTRPDYWTIPVREMRVGDFMYKINEALIDTGASLIILPQRLYQKLQKQFFSQYCSDSNGESLRECECPQNADYPNITIISEGISFDIMPTDYLLGSITSQQCYLAIDKIENINFIILGDVFLQQHFVLFDKAHSRIGFINNHRSLVSYIQSRFLVKVLKFIGFGVILATIGVVFVKDKNKSKRKNRNDSPSGGLYVELVK